MGTVWIRSGRRTSEWEELKWCSTGLGCVGKKCFLEVACGKWRSGARCKGGWDESSGGLGSYRQKWDQLSNCLWWSRSLRADDKIKTLAVSFVLSFVLTYIFVYNFVFSFNRLTLLFVSSQKITLTDIRNIAWKTSLFLMQQSVKKINAPFHVTREMQINITMRYRCTPINPKSGTLTPADAEKWFHLYEVYRVGKFTDIEGRVEVNQGLGAGWRGEEGVIV